MKIYKKNYNIDANIERTVCGLENEVWRMEKSKKGMMKAHKRQMVMRQITMSLMTMVAY